MDAITQRSLQLAAGHFAGGRFTEAAEICRKIVAASPLEVEALHLLALINRKTGDFTESERLFTRCLGIAPNRADIRANFGNLLVAGGLREEAIAEYRQALTHDPGFRPARLALARQLNAAEQFDAAEAEAERLIDANANDAEAWLVKGKALRSTNRPDDAEAAYRTAIRSKPGYSIAHHNLGALLAHKSRSDEALVELDRAAELGLQGPELAFNRASALIGLYEFDQAEAELLDAIHKTPAAIEPLRLLARLRFMRGASDYVTEFENSIAAVPNSVALRLALGQVLNAAGELDRAEAVLLDARDRAPRSAPILSELAAVYQEAGRFDEALQNARLAAAAAPEAIQPRDMLIDALLSLGLAAEAMPVIEEMRARLPENQAYIAQEATAARLLNDPRYEFLYDYEHLVQPFDLSAPQGWSDMHAFQTDLIEALEKRHRFQSHPLDQSLRGGTQTPRGLLGDPDRILKAFIGAMSEPIEAYRERIGFDDAHPMKSRNRGVTRLTGCWSVKLKRGGFHVNHVHPEGWISSAYYVRVPEEVQDTEAKSGWIKFGEPRFPVPGATAEKTVQPRAGRLVLFPSYMWHGTMPIRGNDPRLTIAFDAIPDAGDE